MLKNIFLLYVMTNLISLNNVNIIKFIINNLIVMRIKFLRNDKINHNKIN